MDLKYLQEKKSSVESSFEAKRTEREELASKINEIDTELIKLQGEYRVVSDLIDNLNNKESKNGK